MEKGSDFFSQRFIIKYIFISNLKKSLCICPLLHSSLTLGFAVWVGLKAYRFAQSFQLSCLSEST